MNGEITPLAVRFWGDYACFTRPELKVERVSYPAPTPSAVRGLLESIFWKPEMRWRVQEVRILRPIRTTSILRNEVNSKASMASARSPYLADVDHVQRQTLALRDVDYVVLAQIDVMPGVSEDPAKFRDQFRRRVERGECYRTPYLGCREFTADFAPAEGTERPIDHEEDLGLMLFDLRYEPGVERARPVFFPARIEAGVLAVPQHLYQEAPNGPR